MAYRTNRVNSAGIEPKNSNVIDPKFLPRERKFRKQFQKNIKEKYGPRNLSCMKYPAQAAPQHARPTIDFSDPPGPYASATSHVRDVRYGRRTLDRD
jgi:hypothetical protein